MERWKLPWKCNLVVRMVNVLCSLEKGLELELCILKLVCLCRYLALFPQFLDGAFKRMCMFVGAMFDEN